MNKKHQPYRHIAALVLLGSAMCAVPAAAQGYGSPGTVNPSADGFLYRAAEMLRTGNYAGTIDQLSAALDLDSPLWQGAAEGDGTNACCRAKAMLLRAAYERGDEELFNSLYEPFLKEYGGTGYALPVQLLNADFRFFKGDYPGAVRAYSNLDFSALDPVEEALYEYRLGLSYVRTGYFNEAKDIFSRLQTTPGYAQVSRFYLAYIDYVKGNLATARSGFEAVQQPLASELGADYYIAQIDFQEGKYRAVISKSASLLSSGHKEWIPEINRITGESWYNLGDYDAAEKYLRAYIAEDKEPELSALYDLGVICYGNRQYDEASSYFSRLVNEEDAMSQSSLLYMGQIAARRGDYSSAALSFRSAYELNIDSKVTETALYDYAVATIKGGGVPFGSSADMLERFVKRFPDSPYAAKVDEHLATACYNDGDFLGALRHIERLKRPSTQALESKQKILFRLGVSAMGKKDYASAAKYMKRAADMAGKADRQLAAQASLWEGDALYAQGDYSAATTAYSRFVKESNKRADNRALGLYNLAYSLYQEKQFTEARKRFNDALKASPALSSRLAFDAKMRIADCDYYSGNVSNAMEIYSSLASDDANDEADYAAFQHANMLGTTGDIKGKINELEKMLAKWSSSRWASDARLELVAALCRDGQTSRAASIASEMQSSEPSAPQTRKAALAVAASWQDCGEDAKAISAYKKLVKRWPTSAEAGDAIKGLKTLYTEAGDLQSYISFLDSVPEAPRPDAAEMESLAFESAMKSAERNPGNIKALEEYISKYPYGVNLDRALLAVAMNCDAAGDISGAIVYVDQLLKQRPDSESVPVALMLKGQLLEKQGDNKSAAATWRRLLDEGGNLYTSAALSGLMRTSSKPSDVVAYADRVMSLGDADGEEIAAAIIAKGEALQNLGRSDDARAVLGTLVDEPQTEAGAHAAVLSGEILVAQKKYSQAVKEMEEFIDSDTPQYYWLARGYITLADALSAQGDTYKAKQYLQALKDNYPGDEADITEMINTRLSKWK